MRNSALGQKSSACRGLGKEGGAAHPLLPFCFSFHYLLPELSLPARLGQGPSIIGFQRGRVVEILRGYGCREGEFHDCLAWAAVPRQLFIFKKAYVTLDLRILWSRFCFYISL